MYRQKKPVNLKNLAHPVRRKDFEGVWWTCYDVSLLVLRILGIWLQETIDAKAEQAKGSQRVDQQLAVFSTALKNQIVTVNSIVFRKRYSVANFGRVETSQPEGRGFQSRSIRHVGTLDKSLTSSCLCRFGVKLRHTIRAVSGALLSSSRLEKAL